MSHRDVEPTRWADQVGKAEGESGRIAAGLRRLQDAPPADPRRLRWIENQIRYAAVGRTSPWRFAMALGVTGLLLALASGGAWALVGAWKHAREVTTVTTETGTTVLARRRGRLTVRGKTRLLLPTDESKPILLDQGELLVAAGADPLSVRMGDATINVDSHATAQLRFSPLGPDVRAIEGKSHVQTGDTTVALVAGQVFGRAHAVTPEPPAIADPKTPAPTKGPGDGVDTLPGLPASSPAPSSAGPHATPEPASGGDRPPASRRSVVRTARPAVAARTASASLGAARGAAESEAPSATTPGQATSVNAEPQAGSPTAASPGTASPVAALNAPASGAADPPAAAEEEPEKSLFPAGPTAPPPIGRWSQLPNEAAGTRQSQRSANGPSSAAIAQLPPLKLAAATPLPTQAIPAEEAALLLQALRTLRKDRDPAGALMLLSDHARRFPQTVLSDEISLAEVEALLAAGRHEAALARLDAMPLSKLPRSRTLLLARGELRMLRRGCQPAAEDLRAVAQSMDDDLAERALYGAWTCLTNEGDAVAARQLLLESLRRFPRGRWAGLYRGRLANP